MLRVSHTVDGGQLVPSLEGADRSTSMEEMHCCGCRSAGFTYCILTT